jgi:hypothetical protein
MCSVCVDGADCCQAPNAGCDGLPMQVVVPVVVGVPKRPEWAAAVG